MKRHLSETVVQGIMQHLLERFGEPIGKATDTGPGVADERGGKPRKGEDPGNYGWGSQLSEDVDQGEVNEPTCQGCGAMMPMESDSCNQCGMMAQNMDEEAVPATTAPPPSSSPPPPPKPTPAKAPPPPSSSAPPPPSSSMDEKAPPGREKQVRALKKQKGVKNPFAVAWASYNKSH